MDFSLHEDYDANDDYDYDDDGDGDDVDDHHRKDAVNIEAKTAVIANGFDDSH